MGRRTGCRILISSRPAARTGWIVIALLLLAAGCGVDRSLDDTLLEAEIADQLLPQYPDAIRSVSCPSEQDPVPGMSLLCVATLGAQVIDVNVEIGGTEDALTTSASVDARFVAINEVAALLAATFGDEIGIRTSVECGQPVLALPVDASVVCRATDPSGITRNFDVGVDANGVVTVELR